MLTRTGAALPEWVHVQARAIVNYLAIGSWMKSNDFSWGRRESCRPDVWLHIVKKVADKRVLYLEFGVFRGTATRFWSSHLKNAQSILHGFDSFEGLPDEGGPWTKGQFDASGVIPQIDDDRVSFFKGWFENTLPSYVAPEHDVLVVNLDADLYESTACVLKHIEPLIVPGSFLYFDEMIHVDHEPRAFKEFIERSGRKFKPVAADRTLTHVAFECTE